MLTVNQWAHSECAPLFSPHLWIDESIIKVLKLANILTMNHSLPCIALLKSQYYCDEHAGTRSCPLSEGILMALFGGSSSFRVCHLLKKCCGTNGSSSVWSYIAFCSLFAYRTEYGNFHVVICIKGGCESETKSIFVDRYPVCEKHNNCIIQVTSHLHRKVRYIAMIVCIMKGNLI